MVWLQCKLLVFLILCAALVFGSTAQDAMAASSPGKSSTHASSDSHQDEDEKPGPTVVVVPVLVLPVTNDLGELLSYGYILIHLEIPNPLDRWDVEAKIPFIKDAFIRELHAAPTTVSGSDELDVEGLNARLSELIHAMVGNRVGEVIFKEIAFPPN